MKQIEYAKDEQLQGNDATRAVTWEGLGLEDVGKPIDVTESEERTVQVLGEFGSRGALVIEGSLDGEHFRTLTDSEGFELELTDDALKTVSEAVRFARPRVAKGDANTKLTVIFFVRRTA